MNLIRKFIILTAVFVSCTAVVFAENTDKKSISEKVVTPVGWAIGGAITPVYLGYDYTQKSLDWSYRNVL